MGCCACKHLQISCMFLYQHSWTCRGGRRWISGRDVTSKGRQLAFWHHGFRGPCGCPVIRVPGQCGEHCRGCVLYEQLHASPSFLLPQVLCLGKSDLHCEHAQFGTACHPILAGYSACGGSKKGPGKPFSAEVMKLISKHLCRKQRCC